ncbi:MAG: putative zinc-binding metallopeptidase [Halioglobus sp.]|nr:putative zinc-binding metallopeptidase [Halioglobus sp.]
MRQFYCRCGQQVFFDSEFCLRCGSRLGFDPEEMQIMALTEGADGIWIGAQNKSYRLCENGVNYGVCNWLVPANQAHPLCSGCQFNRTVPNQSLPANRQRWQRLEEGKKRLLYTLRQLRVPLRNGWSAPRNGLLFDFIEDTRSQLHYGEAMVHTGYLDGVITINVLEADDLARETQRLQMNEPYRTVLGHMRHESGHYFWQRFASNATQLEAFRALFGDERSDYAAALDAYYASDPSPDWREHFISAYASAHPLEDWAETWGHYLHIHDALDTAAAHGLLGTDPSIMGSAKRIATWRRLSVTLNELNRSVGRGDAYPFVLNSAVEKKLSFVNRVIGQLQIQNPVKVTG